MALTPAMLQYLEKHEEVKDAILLFRMGDFYEMFFDDAITVSKELELTLTGKDCGLEERAPMCGFPVHSVETYSAKLIEKGYKVAICEQVEDPNTTKGLVKREIIKVLTPGTITEGPFIDTTKNNFIMSIFLDKRSVGCAYLDVLTGDFLVCESDKKDKEDFILTQISKYNPTEILLSTKLFEDSKLIKKIKGISQAFLEPIQTKTFTFQKAANLLTEQYQIFSIEALGFSDKKNALKAAGSILKYLNSNHQENLLHLKNISYITEEDTMALDSSSIRNLELLKTIRGESKKGSLLGLLDQTLTAGGSRLLISYIQSPLINKEKINARLNRVEEYFLNQAENKNLRNFLKQVYDIERICSKLSYKNIVTADLISLKQSLETYKKIKEFVKSTNLSLLKEDLEIIPNLDNISELIEKSINDNTKERTEYKIKNGFNRELDELRDKLENTQDYLDKMLQKEQHQTDIKNLKLKFNKVFGYFFEVPNSQKDKVPSYFIRKQTLVNAERYFTEELKTFEEELKLAKDNFEKLESKIFTEIIETIKKDISSLQEIAQILSKIDVYSTLAKISFENNYVKPLIKEDNSLKIISGRHPVIEQLIGENYFISNDTYFDHDHYTMIITGPNMAGKSTYIRQTALIVLLAQIGCFVPAKKAEIGIVDKIFTRVGASDDISTGQSTFMVEMSEVSYILKNASENSLVILDEIGRGTSTYDGISIAWAITEKLLSKKAKVLFATHYHELIELENQLTGVKNYFIDVKETKDGIIFLRKIKPGSAERSFGIEVAKLAGFPKDVLQRAEGVLEELEEKKGFRQIRFTTKKDETNKALSYLEDLNPDELTPRQAQEALYHLKELNLEN